jgi:hypothetical protein
MDDIHKEKIMLHDYLHFQYHQMLEQELIKKANEIRTINTQLKTERNWRNIMDNKLSKNEFFKRNALAKLNDIMQAAWIRSGYRLGSDGEDR